ncbi:MAG: flavin reductase family protein [Planctomycetes bacterium]|nr:flavin reductase family protein [Planctomycetota bacterium]
MKKITLAESNKITSPNPLTLVCTAAPDGKTNIAPISWWTKLSFKPEMICFAMAKPSYSGDMVRETGKVILAMPTEEVAEAAFACGTVSGRDTDKVAKFSIPMTEVPGSAIHIPNATCLAFLCDLVNTVDVGDHYLYVCTIDKIYGDTNLKALFAWDEETVSLRPAR